MSAKTRIRHRSNGHAEVGHTATADSNTKTVDSDGRTTLKRNVGLIGGIAFTAGTMIGSGIFVSPKGVLAGAGSSGLGLLIWCMGGVVSMIGAISYAELGCMIAKSGGEYVYLLQAFHPVTAYLFSFISTLLLKPSTSAIICLTCSHYLTTLFWADDCGAPPTLTVKLFAVAILATLATVNVMSVKAATQVQVVFTFAKLLALFIIIVGGIFRLAQGYTENISFRGDSPTFGSVALGFYSSMWAYDGWNNLNYMTEELINPEKNLPRSIMLGIPLVMIVYVLTNISYFTVLTPEALLASPAVAKNWAEVVMPQFAWMMPLFVALSTFGAANGSLFTAGRLVFSAAREGHTIKVLSYINVNRFSPAPAIIFTVVIGACMLIPSDIETLIDFFSFAAWMFYFLVFVALIYMRYTQPDAIRPYKVPIIFPAVAAIFSLFLVLAPIIDEPKMEYLYAFLFLVSGVIFYFPFVHFKKELAFMKHINIGAQLFFQVAPGEGPDDIVLQDYNSLGDSTPIIRNSVNTIKPLQNGMDTNTGERFKTDTFNTPL